MTSAYCSIFPPLQDTREGERDRPYPGARVGAGPRDLYGRQGKAGASPTHCRTSAITHDLNRQPQCSAEEDRQSP